MEAIFVHGALVTDGDWWWRPTAELLARSGVRSRAVALPSTGDAAVDDGSADLAADAQSLRAALDAVDGSAVVIGHSYGGTVIAEAGLHPAVERLILISSYLPEVALSQSDIMSDERHPVMVEPREDGRMQLAGYDEASFAARFLHDVAPELWVEAWRRTAPQSIAALTTPTTADGWRGADSTYLVCLDDQSTSVELQRQHAARATRAVEIPTGHHPFLSRPDLVAQHVLHDRAA